MLEQLPIDESTIRNIHIDPALIDFRLSPHRVLSLRILREHSCFSQVIFLPRTNQWEVLLCDGYGDDIPPEPSTSECTKCSFLQRRPKLMFWFDFATS